MILKCDLPQINTPQAISMVIKSFLALFVINSCQFHMIKIFWVWSSPLKVTILQMRSLSTKWLQMSHFIISVLDHGKCGIILKLSAVGFHSCVFSKFSVVAMAAGAKNWSKQSKNGNFCNFCNFVWYLSAIYPKLTHLRASVWLSKTSLLFFWSIHGNFIWLEYFGSEVQSFENADTANV